ncbi:lysophospholipid acyltransferase family protein [uncultured Algimonas sp.]|uniref:lysophospholipid acyltransferase family protein n=1 Tax=uncultured Algimonas sp. TaxID=1547920 RepID=UPI002636B182|nr:lysophospholipid acyltransferase family protein [uncultured Algimonas sp.]
MFKRLMRSSAMQAVIGGLVALWMTLVKYTTRWDVRHSERAAPVIDSGEGLIALTFHSRFLLLTSAWKRRFQHPHVLISRSRDGAVVDWTCRWLGLSTVRGSARNAAKTKAKGGGKAGREILDALEAGGCIVITPDGPRGPRQRVPIGPFRLARMSGAPVLPCTFAVANRKQFDSWDRFVLPLPFGRGRIVWGTPQRIPADATDADLEVRRLGVETEMNALMAEADESLGHVAVAPA